MRKYLLSILVVSLSISCANNRADNRDENNNIITVDGFYQDPVTHVDQNIQITGLVTHVCRHGGQKLFIKGTGDNIYLRVNTNEKITEFPLELEGSMVEFTGKIVLMDNKTTIATLTEEHAHHGEDTCAAEQSISEEASYYLLAEKYVVVK